MFAAPRGQVTGLAPTDDGRARRLTKGRGGSHSYLRMMSAPTVTTIEDLVRVLDENPGWLEALRSRLLPRELLKLPHQLAEFAADVKRQFEAISRQFETIDRQFEAIDQRFEAIDQRFEAIDRRFEAIDRRFEAIDRRFEAIDRRFERLETDLGPIKAAHARNAALREADLIAEQCGLTFVRILSDAEVRDLVAASDTAGLSVPELRSFRRADLIVEARDEAGERCYLAAEISFTANGRDTTRAIRNAGLLERFTGVRAYAAIAGLRHDDRIRDRIAAGEVTWYQLDPHALEVE